MRKKAYFNKTINYQEILHFEYTNKNLFLLYYSKRTLKKMFKYILAGFILFNLGKQMQQFSL